ncbi:FAD linked oxidase domain-containing protein [Alicyclobacillus hesperidum URH17-3-68]|uniref:FAD-binding protein n=1 Tax=Alicyclobacillus hesperidum TaxID=89784 RepID=A0A1H2XIZ5_9BACL|nr:FAD-linked oxidase C-terminal domain-containing protein [Alicyclobacillus hesperidum]EJY55572.1 FAD linked oxidase domain-containing protein [Alicyclobacillus hesperidum URH17-3-68]GLV14484.1 FAD-binding protein [Alicyclobacillus hesperidum]SDW92815.1 glycolate oxidase [Alicyclobacillus hesperidum]
MRDSHIDALVEIVGERRCLWQPNQVRAYACDGYTAESGLPRAVVFPESTDEVAQICRYLYEHEIPYLPRGAGTGLSGGATPTGGQVVINLARMNRLLAVDFANLRAIVQPGLVNLTLTRRIAHEDCYYAPDPSSQSVCTIGGNFAENAGGSHCLKYGVTTNHIVAAKVVLPDGSVIDVGAPFGDAPGYDLLGLLVGSEGTLGIATEITVRILKKPQSLRTALAYFDRVADASDTVTDIIVAGIIPAAIEMMDQLAMQAVDKSNYHVGYPNDIEAVLLIEVDGLTAGVDDVMERVVELCRKHHVREVRVAQSDGERALWWSSRKMAFGAMGRLSPDYIVQDGVIPRTRLTEVLQKIEGISRRYGLRIANVFHAGDGNLHPLVLYDSRVPGEAERAVRAGSEVLRACVDAGGSITGEHGVGIEKIGEMAYMFSEDELQVQRAVKACFDGKGIVNAGKLIPLPGRCVEVKHAREIIDDHWQILNSFPDQAEVQVRAARAEKTAAKPTTSVQG